MTNGFLMKLGRFMAEQVRDEHLFDEDVEPFIKAIAYQFAESAGQWEEISDRLHEGLASGGWYQGQGE